MYLRYGIWVFAAIIAFSLHFVLFLSFDMPKSGAQELGSNGIHASILEIKKSNPVTDADSYKKSENKNEKIKQNKPKKKSTSKQQKKPKAIAKAKPKIKKQISTQKITPIDKDSSKAIVEAKTYKEAIQEDNQPSSYQKKSESNKTAKLSSYSNKPSPTGISKQTNLGGASTKAKADYLARLKHLLESKKRYPERAKKRRQEGIVKIWVKIDKNGDLLSYKIKESSGHRLLDREVENLLKRVTPLPKFTNEMNLASLEVTVPMAFKIK